VVPQVGECWRVLGGCRNITGRETYEKNRKAESRDRVQHIICNIRLTTLADTWMAGEVVGA